MWSTLSSSRKIRTMNITIKTLRVVFWFPLVVAALTVVLYESGVLPVGVLAADGSEYSAVAIAELLTVVLLPAAAFLRSSKAALRDMVRRGPAAAARWWLLRLVMAAVPLMANTVLYYVYMRPSFGYMAMMSAVIMVFVYPRKRLQHDGK